MNDAHLRALDESAPGLVAAAHVVGSAALDDHQPGSDLDLVVELSRPPTPADLAALAAAQTLDLDVVYLVDGEPGPWARDGEFRVSGGEVTPVVLLQLNEHSTTLRGARPSFEVTRAEVEDYCRRNLVEYWRPLVELAAAATGPGFPQGVLWIAFGPARQWHTIRTGGIVSKSRAGELAAAHWPDLAGELLDLVAARRGADVELTAAHREAAVELGRRVLAEV
ncbi:nucleotidyltransferase domain-containing protein [Saccharothrix yanglingensis]|uniref:nucleotidyltransferase domain-containing protein n=1 Tax=Saccharothrix yanglingensis TaxID=659496 RepID=UPI0027D20015|nr:nucleotidyltransferase domain-containing protein [Saccharothrix yanglingensis]